MAATTVVTHQGYSTATGRLIGTTQATPNEMGIGTGADTAAATDTALFTEETTANWAGYARGSAAGTQVTTTTTDDTAQWVNTFTNPSTGTAQTITEAGLFDAAGASPQTTLSAAVTSATATSITVTAATGFPTSGNYYAQVSTEVMEVTAGQGTTTWTVTRGANGSTALASINSGTVVQGGQSTAGGDMALHSSFTGIALQPGDSLQMTCQIIAS